MFRSSARLVTTGLLGGNGTSALDKTSWEAISSASFGFEERAFKTRTGSHTHLETVSSRFQPRIKRRAGGSGSRSTNSSSVSSRVNPNALRSDHGEGDKTLASVWQPSQASSTEGPEACAHTEVGEAAAPAILPMELRVGDHLTDETASTRSSAGRTRPRAGKQRTFASSGSSPTPPWSKSGARANASRWNEEPIGLALRSRRGSAADSRLCGVVRFNLPSPGERHLRQRGRAEPSRVRAESTAAVTANKGGAWWRPKRSSGCG